MISAEGTLETAPTIGYADIISDLVSSGQTLKDNRLRALPDGVIQPSQAALIANRKALQTNPNALEMARRLLEYLEAHLRAEENLLVVANMRGESPEGIAQRMFNETTVSGLQGPTISPVIVRDAKQKWFSVSIVVRRADLSRAITELRNIGGSGIIVSPVTYIFEEEPPRYKAMLKRSAIGDLCSNNMILNSQDKPSSSAPRRMNSPSASASWMGLLNSLANA